MGTKKAPDYLPRTISQYVPSMAFAADIIDGVHIVSLGAPAALDADGIFDGVAAEATAQTHLPSAFATTFDGSSTSLTTTAGMIDALYGRVLTMVGSAGSNHVVTVHGRDYLGQAMRENFTLSGTNTIYGKKAFKFIDKVTVAAGAAGDTFDVGWSDVLGLPYMSEVLLGWTEDNVQKGVRRGVSSGPIAITWATDATQFGLSPVAGFVTGVMAVSLVATTVADETITVEVGGTAVAGLSMTIAFSGAAIGDVDSDMAETDDHGNTGRVAQGGAVEAVSANASTAGGGEVFVLIDENVRFIPGDTTATQTATTGDPRGTVRPYTLCNGSVVFEVRYTVNMTNLHGNAQFNG